MSSIPPTDLADLVRRHRPFGLQQLALIRLVGAVLADQNDESAKHAPYFDLDAIGDTHQDQQRRRKVSKGKPEKVATPRVLTA